MSDRKEKLTRREALSALGTATAAAMIVSAAAKTGHAQSSVLSFVIDTYRAYYYSALQYNYDARIILYSAGNAQNCSLYFMKEGQSIPSNTVSVSGVSANVYFDSSRLGHVRELLRNERPMRLTVNGTNGIATLSNEDYELVGDGDI